MKAIPYIKLMALAFYTIACANKNHDENASENVTEDTTVKVNAVTVDTFETGKVITHVSCKSDANQSYALYIPAKEGDKALPVIYFFDPHGDGSFPLDKYKALADENGLILIGSNNSKNGNDWPASENIWKILYNDSQKRLKINNNMVFACGFSGGAKVAGYVALNHPEVKSIIVNGAGLPDGTPAGNFNFTVTAVAGEGDMNMTDLVAMNAQLDKTLTSHRIIFFSGKHEWAPAATMDIAFKGLQLDAMRKKLVPQNDLFVNDFVAEGKNRIQMNLKAGRLVQAAQECTFYIGVLNGITSEMSWFQEKENAVIANPVYQQELQAQQNLQAKEQDLKTLYEQQFQQGDMNYWQKTIGDLQQKAKAPTAEGGMYQRLLAYLSLAFYSISNRFIVAGQNNEAQYFVSLYKLADAGNSEAWYFSAILNARNNNAKGTEDDLLRAASNGFNDKARMMQQPEFQKLSTPINFSAIESKMGNAK